jgi:putative endonuclease
MSSELQYFVYIMASKRHGTLYIGITSRLLARSWEHKNDVREGFTKKYRVHALVYYESFSDVHQAITREKQLKGWNRAWKIKLIEAVNPDWVDLYDRRLIEEGYSVEPAAAAER